MQVCSRSGTLPVVRGAPLRGAVLICCRLDNEFIVLRGSESEASSQLLKGSVILCLPQATKVESVHLRMTGQLKVG